MPSLLDVVHPSWALALEPVRDDLASLERFLHDEGLAGREFFPSKHRIMRAFERPLSDVKVLLVGQDPYPTPGHATGLSFSVSPEIAIPRSLNNIFTELVSDVGCPKPTSGDLSPWVDQGVMLLNRVLTVSAGMAGSHQGKGWERVTECAVDALVARQRPLVAILWGRQAQVLQQRMIGVACVLSAHPSPLSASQGFFGSKPFSRTNQSLANQGAAPIDWCLP